MMKHLDYLLTKASDWGVNQIVIEDNFGDGMYTQILMSRMKEMHEPGGSNGTWNGAVEERKVSGQKELRLIDTLEPALAKHKVIVSEDALRKDYDSIPTERGDLAPLYRMTYQLSRLQRVKAALPHDDRVEAIEGCIHYWLEGIAQANNKQAQKARDKDWREEVKSYNKFLVGSEKRRKGTFRSARKAY